MHDGHNTVWSVGGHPGGARGCRCRANARNGFPVTADRVFITAGTSEGIELDARGVNQRGRRSARADADLPALHRGARQSSTPKRNYYRLDPSRGWMPDLAHLESLVTTGDEAPS